MKPGLYYVGDLCYILRDKQWDEVCSQIIRGGKTRDGEFILADGREFAIYSTLLGDGSFLGNDGNEYLVDSGTIGCVAVETKDPKLEELGNYHNFAEDFSTGSQDGVIWFGTVIIDTESLFWDIEIHDNGSDETDDE